MGGVFLVFSLLYGAQSVDFALDEGIRRYWNGEYERTVGLLSTACALEAGRGEKIDCYKYLAFSHVALGEESEAERQFVALLSTDPAHRLDPALASPKIIRRFDASRRQLADRLYTEGKDAYYRQSFAEASELMRQVLLLEPEDELAREYRELSQERLRVEEERAIPVETAAASEPSPAPPPEDKVYRLTSEIDRPVLLERIAPEYPRIDRSRGVEGEVVLTLVIDKSGLVRDSTIVRSVSRTIDRAALDAVSRWRYQPATMNGTPVAVHGVVSLSFELGR